MESCPWDSRRLVRVAPLLLAASGLAAQATAVLPPGAAGTEQPSSEVVPWTTAFPLTQTVYPAAMFASQGVDFPITITRLRWRANGGSAHAAANVTATVGLGTTLRAAPHRTFADNRHGGFATVFAGPVALAAGGGTTPNVWAVDVPIAPYAYDPDSGLNLLLEVACSGSSLVVLDALHDPTLGGSVYSSVQSVTEGNQQSSRLPVVEVGYMPTFPLLARFAATGTSGASPLQVQFTDRSFCADPAGVQSWQWDLDGDGTTDSTARHPTFTYAACGSYPVRLTVTDAQNRTHSSVQPGFVQVDPLTASFVATVSAGPAPLQVTFTDTSSPAPTSHQWDFNGDGVADATAASATWTFGDGLHPVRLTVQRGCRTVSAVRTIAAGRVLQAPQFPQATGMATGSLVTFDIAVHAPDGIDLLGFNAAVPLCCNPLATFTLLVTPGSRVGAETDGSKWRIGTLGRSSPLPNGGWSGAIPFDRPLHLAQGSYGIGLGYTGLWGYSGPALVSGSAPFGNADLSIGAGELRLEPFRGPSSARSLYGSFVYSRSGVDRTGGYGFFAAGCATSAGQTWISSRDGWGPRLGRTLETVLDVVPGASPGFFAITGFDRTSTVLGPLPLGLGPFGLPGCLLHVRDDLVRFVGGANSWSTAIPNAASLLAVQFYQQAVVLDPALGNPAGASISDAAAAVIGQ